MAKTENAARLREIAAKIRHVAGACNEEGYWNGCIAIGPLFKEAHEVGAWQREGSQIGDRLKRVSADRQDLWTDGQTPVWMIDAYFAVVEPLTSHLMPPTGEKEHLELEAGIAADEIEEEAKRIEAGEGEQHEHLVTLQQAAAMVCRSKKTLERRKADDPKFPMPRVAGGGGKPDEYAWSEMRLYLEGEFKRKLPEQFPAAQFVRS
jgi:hypothetical protein